MKSILIGTHNPGKIALYKKYLSELGVPYLTLDELSLNEKAPEDGKSFAEISMSKAIFYLQASGYPALTDDGGLEIAFLHGAPGALSRRWPGYEASDEELVDYALAKLRGVPWEKRIATLGGVISYASPDHPVRQADIAIQGIISERLERPLAPGFPFRSIFWIPDLQKYYVDLTDEELRQLDHRRRGLIQIKKYLYDE